MCEPTTIASLAIAAASTGVKAVGDGQQADYASKLAGRNRGLLLQAAADARARGEQDAGDLQLKAGQEIGATRTAIGASGLEASGSALNVLADQRMMSAVDVARTRNNAAREAWGYEVQADEQGAQALMAKRAGAGAVASTFLGGLGQATAIGGDYFARKARGG